MLAALVAALALVVWTPRPAEAYSSLASPQGVLVMAELGVQAGSLDRAKYDGLIRGVSGGMAGASALAGPAQTALPAGSVKPTSGSRFVPRGRVGTAVNLAANAAAVALAFFGLRGSPGQDFEVAPAPPGTNGWLVGPAWSWSSPSATGGWEAATFNPTTRQVAVTVSPWSTPSTANWMMEWTCKGQPELRGSKTYKPSNQTTSPRAETIDLYSPTGCASGALGFFRLWYTGSTSGSSIPNGTTLAQWSEDPGQVTGHAVQTLTCRGAGGSVQTVVTQTPVVTLGPGQRTPELPPSACPPGTVLGGAAIDWVSPSKTEPLVEPYTAPSWVTTVPDAYPDCLGSECLLTLHRVDVQPEVECSSGAAGGLCRDWLADTAREARYDCRWGPYTVELARCAQYANVGQPEPLWAEPVAPGEPLPYPQPAPEPGSAGRPDGSDGSDCWPSGWGVLNPLEWVYRPVLCALSAAFVPGEPELQAEVARVRQAFDGSPPGVMLGGWAGAVGGIADVPAAASGCMGPPLTLHVAALGFGPHVVYPLAACEAPMSTVARIVKAVATAAVYIGATTLCAGVLGASLGIRLPNGRGGLTP